MAAPDDDDAPQPSHGGDRGSARGRRGGARAPAQHPPPDQRAPPPPSSSSKLPFGSLMKGINDCDRPACDDTVSALTAALGRLDARKTKDGGDESVTDDAWRRSVSDEKVDCPPGSGQIGKASWTLLHSMVAWYPEKPSPSDRSRMTNFFDALSIFYPCTYCAEDFRKNFEEHPIRTESRTELCQWLCEQHNLVNVKLGKTPFSCDMKDLDERWRKSSDPRCKGGDH